MCKIYTNHSKKKKITTTFSIIVHNDAAEFRTERTFSSSRGENDEQNLSFVFQASFPLQVMANKANYRTTNNYYLFIFM